MNKMIKSLLMMALAVFVGQAFAADPVATWTDFNTLTSGNYTLTKDADCTVNADGSITLGGAGLTVTLPESKDGVTVVMEVSNIHAENHTLIDYTLNGDNNHISLFTWSKNPDGPTLEQWWNTSKYATNQELFESVTWPNDSNARRTVAMAYAAGSGTTTYINGVKLINNNSLMSSGDNGKVVNICIGSYNGTDKYAVNMKIHSLRLYSSKLTDQEVNEETNSRFTYVGGLEANNVVTIGNAINVASEKTVRTIGFLNFANGENSVDAGGTLEVVSGETTFNAKVKGINGTLTVNKDATFKNVKVDALAYDQSVIVNVYGSLDMGISRWTIGGDNTLNLFAGATVSGEGQGQNGALDWYRKSPIYIKAVSDENADSSVTISANLRTRDYGDINFNIEEGMIANVSGDISGNCKVSVEGKGVLKLFGKNTYSGSTTISSEAKVVVATTGDVPAFSENLEEANGVFVYGTLEFISSKMLYRSFDGDGTIVIKGDVAINNTGDSGKRTGLSRFKGSVIVDEGKKLTLTSWNNPYEITLKSLALNGTIDMYPTGGNGRTVSIKTSRIEGNGNVVHTSQNSGNYIFALLDEAEIDVSKGHVTVESDVTVEGSVTVLGVAGATVLTCNNAADIATRLTAPEGLMCVVDGNSIKLAVKQYTITLPEVGNATWSYNGQTVSGSITVAHGMKVVLTLVANDGYEFENGEALIEITFDEVNGNIAADAFAGIAAPEPEIVGKGVWGGIDWTLDALGKLTIKPTTGTPVPDENAPTKRTYEVGEWRETVIYNSKGVGIEIGGTPYDMKAVKKLVIEEGVTMIGSFTCQFPNLTGEVVIPSTVAYIGQEAFHKTPITTLTFAEGGTAPLCIANGAFKKIHIEEVSLPKDRAYIHVHHWAFGGCPNLKRAFIPGNITKVWGGEHVDYLSNFEAQTNVTWAEYGSIFTGCTKMESITFENEKARDLFFSNNRNSSDKDYIVAYAGLKAYNSLRAAFDAAEDGDKVGPVMNITLKDEWIGNNSAFFTIKDKNIVFDLGGRTISWKGSDGMSLSAVFAVEGTGSLTLVDELNKNWKYRGAGTISVTSNGAQVFSLLAAIGDDSSLTVNGGTYTLNTAMDSLVYSENDNTEINAGTFKLLNAASGAKIINTYGENQLQVVVNGGTYNADLNSQELVGEVAIDKDRFACKDNGDGTWSVLPAVAYIAGGSVSYATLEDAFKAVKAGDTIEILDDVTVTEPWNCSEAGARFTGSVTINGNGKTITFANVVDDGVTNMAALYFEKDAVVNDLTIVMGEPTTVYSLRSRMASTKSAISAKGNLTVDNCAFVGSGDNANAIVYGDGTDGSEGVTVTISNSSFTGWDRGVTANGSDNEVGTVVLDGNTFEGSDVHVSASENVTFNNNKMEEGWVDITSYTAQETFMVKATGNDLVANGNGNENRVNAQNVEIQDGFLLPVAEIDGEKYFALQDAVDAAVDGATVKLLADVALAGVVTVNVGNAATLDLNGFTVSGVEGASIVNAGELAIMDSSENMSGMVSVALVNNENAKIQIFGGNYTQNVGPLCADGYATVKTLDNKYVVSAMPTATVSNLGSITVGLGDYTAEMYKTYDLIGGSGLQSAEVPYDLTLAMDFKAKDTAAEAAKNAFGNYTTDFFITMSGMSEESFVGDGCYLAGYYPSFKAWVKIPLDGFTVENDKVYPVITSAGFDFKYTDICGTVGQFICGIYLTPEVLAANPNLTVDLTLGLAENKDAALNAEFFKVDNYVYDADDLQPVTLPEVVITDIKSTLTDADPDLTFALNFAIKDVDKLSKEYLEKLVAKYGDYYTDYVLTISGLTDPDGSVKFNANGNGDGYLAGQYDAWSKSWVTVPFSDVTVKNGQSFYIMEYAAELMGKGGLRLTLKEIAEIVKNFDCGVYFTPEFLAANPNLKVDLELKVFTEDENGNKVGDISVATNMFDKDDFSVEAAKLDIRIVNGKPQIGFAGEGKLVLNAATALTGEWTKNIEYTLVENDGDDTKTWVTPKDGYYFFKGYIVR